MNNIRTESLYQTMMKWIAIHRRINNCDEDASSEALEKWSAEYREQHEGYDAVTFQQALKDSCRDMQDDGSEPEFAVYTVGKVANTITFDIPGFKGITKPSKMPPAIKPPTAQEVKEGLLDDIKLTAVALENNRNKEPTVEVLMARENLMNKLDSFMKMLEMLEGVEVRNKERTGKVLSLKGKR